jgi:hypothetical protein
VIYFYLLDERAYVNGKTLCFFFPLKTKLGSGNRGHLSFLMCFARFLLANIGGEEEGGVWSFPNYNLLKHKNIDHKP